MGYHLGKTMVQEAAEEGHNNPAYLLNSSLPQRPLIIGQLAKPASYGGRPLGPHSYDVPSMPWMDEPERPTASFASKTVVGKERPPVTAEIDFLNKPELIDYQRQVAPGFHSYTWGKQAQRPNDPSDAKLDKFYDVDNKLTQFNLSTVMLHHPRKYAASFLSQDRRFKPQKEIHGLAPGSYDPPPGCVQIKDANRPTYQFKSTADYSTFGSRAPNEPPDMIHSPLMAMQAANWTSKGFPFSTRERFPRVRSKWKD